MTHAATTPGRVVYTEFPRGLLPLLRCCRDAAPLVVDTEQRSGAIGIIEACLRCSVCSTEYRIEDGIARMMDRTLSPETEHEIAIRDVEYACTEPAPFVAPAIGWRSKLNDLLEVAPFLAELKPLNNCKVLELACGDGRFTMTMAQMGAQVLAVDFSINALRKMAAWLPSGIAPTAYPQVRSTQRDLRANIGLVQADASHFHVAPGSFDRALSASPLDSRDERMAMYKTIASALTDEGRYLAGVEHDDLNRRLLGLPIARRYERDGIFIEHFDAATIRREAAPFFLKLRIYPVRPKLPFVVRLPMPIAVGFLRTVAALPLLRQFGELLLVRAERPVRPPAEGANRSGNSLCKGLFRWYAKKIGKEPLWGTDELV